MQDETNIILQNLVNSLQESNPYKIILFGSHAIGNPTEDSDIDLLIILDNNDLPSTYDEKLKKKVYIKSLVRDINRHTALDFLVFSRAEYEKAKKIGNFMLDEIDKTGRIIYEKAS